MDLYTNHGQDIRQKSKNLVLEFMNVHPSSKKNGNGLTLAEISRSCGLDWGNYQNTTSSQQQYWVVALMRELEKENFVERLASKKWRIK